MAGDSLATDETWGGDRYLAKQHIGALRRDVRLTEPMTGRKFG